MSKKNRRETELEEIKRRVDALIDTYETVGCRPGGEFIQVDCFESDLPFAAKGFHGRLHYRGRILIPIKRKQPSKKTIALQQSDIDSCTLRWDDK